MKKLLNNKLFYFTPFFLLIVSCFFVGARGNVYEWGSLLFSQGFEYAFNNPNVDYYSTNNIFFNIIILSVIPLILFFKSKKWFFFSSTVFLIFNLWMVSINCICTHNDGYLVDNGDCIDNYLLDSRFSKNLLYDDYLSQMRENPFLLMIEFNAGTVYENWDNGKKKFEAQIYVGNFNGYFREWDKSGNLITEKYFKANKLSGPSRKWYSNGQLEYEKYYQITNAELEKNKISIILSENCWDKFGKQKKCK